MLRLYGLFGANGMPLLTKYDHKVSFFQAFLDSQAANASLADMRKSWPSDFECEVIELDDKQWNKILEATKDLNIDVVIRIMDGDKA